MLLRVARCRRLFGVRSAATVARPLQQLTEIFASDGASRALAYHEARFNPRSQSLQEYAGAPYEVRDVVVLLFKAYSDSDRMDAGRLLLHVALRDIPRRHLSATLFEAYLQAVASSSRFSRAEVLWVLEKMRELHIAVTEKLYLSLAEIHVRMDVDPRGLWIELLQHEEAAAAAAAAAGANSGADSPQGFLFNVPSSSQPPVHNPFTPSLALAKMILLQSALHHTDYQYSLSVVRRMLRLSPLDRGLLGNYLAGAIAAPDVSTEQALWLLFELEQRCVVARVPLLQHLNKKDLLRLLLKCAQSADADAAVKVLAAMERHLVAKTADVFALMVWAHAAAGDIGAAFDAVEAMARKGFLEHTDAFKRYTIEGIGHTMDRNFLMFLADALHKPQLADAAYFHLERRFADQRSVSVHSLDIVVLACAKLGDDARAAETVESYAHFDVQPRTETYNNLLLACVGRSKARQHSNVFEAMVRNGVQPNQQTFRLLIRQAVLSDNIEEAIAFLRKVPTISGLRVEVEMVLPIIERASRVGDVDTVTKMAKYALDCDVGIDPVVLQTICTNLTKLGVDAVTVQELIPLHEKLRARSKYSRRRARHEV